MDLIVLNPIASHPQEQVASCSGWFDVRCEIGVRKSRMRNGRADSHLGNSLSELRNRNAGVHAHGCLRVLLAVPRLWFRRSAKAWRLLRFLLLRIHALPAPTDLLAGKCAPLSAA